MVQVDEAADGREIELPVGQRLEIGLREHPTTGFRWNLDRSGDPVCRPVKDFFEPGTSSAGGRRCWEFEVTKPGVGAIVLSYRRSWEQENGPARRFFLKVRVPSPKVDRLARDH
jgi:predicted secreted protein